MSWYLGEVPPRGLKPRRPMLSMSGWLMAWTCDVGASIYPGGNVMRCRPTREMGSRGRCLIGPSEAAPSMSSLS